MFFAQLALLGGGTFLLSWLSARWTRSLARRYKAIDEPDGKRKLHGKAVPLFGGLGIIATFLLAVSFAWATGVLSLGAISPMQFLGFLFACLVIAVTGAWDDLVGLSARTRFVVYIGVCLLVVFTGTSIPLITHWYSGQGVYLNWWHIGSLVLPADLLAMVWLLVVLFATKLLDGVDGLVTGQSVIGGGLIALLALTPAFYQPGVALIAMVFLASFLGFLPSNWPKAQQFLGESGSVFAGFGLGVLAVISGAKLATAFMVLGMPMVDVFLVVFDRLQRKQSPLKGDRSHLHHRLLDAGWSSTQVTVILWGLMFTFGATSLVLQTRGKVVLGGVIVLTTVLLSYGARLWTAKHRKV